RAGLSASRLSCELHRLRVGDVRGSEEVVAFCEASGGAACEAVALRLRSGCIKERLRLANGYSQNNWGPKMQHSRSTIRVGATISQRLVVWLPRQDRENAVKNSEIDGICAV